MKNRTSLHAQTRHARLAAPAIALAIVAAACGSSSTATPATSGDAALSDSTPTSAPASSAPAPGDSTPANDTTPSTTSPPPINSGDGAESDGEIENGYLPADEVPDYIAGFSAGLAKSSVTIDGEQLPITGASADGTLAIGFEGGSMDLMIIEGFDGATIFWQGQQWVVEEEPEFLAIPEELDGEGDQLHLILRAAAIGDQTSTISIELDISLQIIGMGNSVVDVVEGYATISGTLGTSTYVQIADVIANNPEVDTLVMLNVAGSENDEINVHTARLIRDAGWTTWVPSNGDISSGGVDMFTAGLNRVVEPGGFVGVHSWSEGEGATGRDYPRDHPAHRSQLEYFTEMLGEEEGTEFYFYTLDASPAERIYRMTPEEIQTYGLATAEAETALPNTIVGEPAGYVELAEGVYLKLVVNQCSIANEGFIANLISNELGPIDITATGATGELSAPALEGAAPVDHLVSAVTLTDDSVSGTINFDIASLVGDLDTSAAEFEIPCAAAI